MAFTPAALSFLVFGPEHEHFFFDKFFYKKK